MVHMLKISNPTSIDGFQNNSAHEHFLSQFNYNNLELTQFNNLMFHFQKTTLNDSKIKNINTNKLNLDEFHTIYKKLLRPSSLLPYNIMKNHPIFSSFASTIDLKIQIDELRKENIELKKQLANHKN